MRDYSIHLHLVSRSHTAEQLTTFHALLLHQTKIDIVLGVAAWRRHGKQRTRQLYRKTRRNRLRVEEFLSSLEHPPPSRQEKEGSNQIKRGNEEDQVWHRPTFKRDQSMITPRAWPTVLIEPPSSIARINSPLTVTNVIHRVYNYLEHCFHEDRSPSLDELISSVNLSLLQTRLYFHPNTRNIVAFLFLRQNIRVSRREISRCTWSVFHFIFLIFVFLF